MNISDENLPKSMSEAPPFYALREVISSFILLFALPQKVQTESQA